MGISTVGTFAQNGAAAPTTLGYTTVNLGDLVVLTDATSSASSATTAVSGGGVSTWQQAGTTVTSSTGAVTSVTMWWGVVTTVGAVTVTVTRSGTPGNCQLNASQFTAGLGSGAVWFVGVSGGAAQTASATMTYPTLAPSMTPTSRLLLYCGYAVTGSTGSAGATTGFTYRVDTFFSSVTCFNPTVTKSSTPTATQSTSAQYVSIGAVFGVTVPVASGQPSTARLTRAANL